MRHVAWAMVGVTVCGCMAPALVVDRLEEERAVLVDERGRQVAVPRAALPAGVHEGDVLRRGRPDPSERARLLSQVRRSRARLFSGAAAEGEAR